MSKLAKYKQKASQAKAYVKEKGKENLGGAGLLIAEFGTHAGLALASANYDSIGPLPVRPDIAGAIVAFGASAFTKGKTRKLAQACLRGAGHAMITRMVGAKKFTIVRGPDGQAVLKEEVAA